ncbi:YveK family protein [Nocardioides xinjiangensis]|uniref:hypothetical protein n=1 Tax=Nocardioides xinjiangensis TaxID=2817376 RepID=UPI001B30F31C|nr:MULTISPECIES: hypothetical protein [unclassified Nocardioides]
MEIVDYLRIARRNLWVLAGVPLLASELALAYVLVTPRPSVAAVHVSAPSLMGSQYGTYPAQGASQFAGNFVALASSPEVQDAVAEETDVSVGDLQDGLSMEQVGSSSVVALTYTNSDSSTTGLVAAAVARQTLTAMFGSQVPSAQAAVDAAKDSVHDANAALAAFAGKHGNLPLSEQYETLTAQITALENDEARYAAEGLAGSADVLSQKLTKLRSRAAQLAPLTTEQADLLAQQQAAMGALTTSQQVLAQAQAQLAAADPNQVQAPAVKKIPLGRLIVMTVLPAAAVGVFLAIALVALLELIAQRRAATTRNRLQLRHESPVGAPAAAAAGGRTPRGDVKRRSRVSAPASEAAGRPAPREEVKRGSPAKAPATAAAGEPAPREEVKRGSPAKAPATAAAGAPAPREDVEREFPAKAPATAAAGAPTPREDVKRRPTPKTVGVSSARRPMPPDRPRAAK